jgi:cysteinyl-tRNA synthetase
MITVYNTLTKKLENLKPQKGKTINLFVCGPTVYDYSHIGHAKTYVQFDVIVKYVRNKFDVFYLQNITDLDDKIIVRAKETKQKPEKLAKKFEKEYYKDMKSLGVDSVSEYARATDHIKAIIKQIDVLLQKGVAYEIQDGIYFDLSKFPNYGKLSGRTSIEAEDAVSRIDEGKEKRNKGDFCVWKRCKKDEPSWEAPWFAGRPGWHIEDTAITETFFGSQYDLHGGARDLLFPHHEAEIALMESVSGNEPLVHYWLHTGFLNVKGKKMAKSLSNFITIREAVEKWGAQPLRWLFASSYYKSPVDFSEGSVFAAAAGLDKLENTLIGVRNRMKAAPDGRVDGAFMKRVKSHEKRFFKEMDADFNTPKATAALFDLARELNGFQGSKKSFECAIVVYTELLDVFGIKFDEFDIPDKVAEIVNKREIARAAGDWGGADKLRDKVDELGFAVDDSETGPIIKKKKNKLTF